MIIKLAINISQIKYFVESALSGFDTLAIEDAIETAKCNLEDLLNYLKRFDERDNTISILFTNNSKSGIVIESIVSDSNI